MLSSAWNLVVMAGKTPLQRGLFMRGSLDGVSEEADFGYVRNILTLEKKHISVNH
jgi:hypothetical protein